MENTPEANLIESRLRNLDMIRVHLSKALGQSKLGQSKRNILNSLKVAYIWAVKENYSGPVNYESLKTWFVSQQN